MASVPPGMYLPPDTVNEYDVQPDPQPDLSPDASVSGMPEMQSAGTPPDPSAAAAAGVSNYADPQLGLSPTKTVLGALPAVLAAALGGHKGMAFGGGYARGYGGALQQNEAQVQQRLHEMRQSLRQQRAELDALPEEDRQKVLTAHPELYQALQNYDSTAGDAKSTVLLAHALNRIQGEVTDLHQTNKIQTEVKGRVELQKGLEAGKTEAEIGEEKALQALPPGQEGPPVDDEVAKRTVLQRHKELAELPIKREEDLATARDDAAEQRREFHADTQAERALRQKDFESREQDRAQNNAMRTAGFYRSAAKDAAARAKQAYNEALADPSVPLKERVSRAKDAQQKLLQERDRNLKEAKALESKFKFPPSDGGGDIPEPPTGSAPTSKPYVINGVGYTLEELKQQHPDVYAKAKASGRI